MAEGENDDKKHDPSERKLREAGERGELPRSTELQGVASTIAVAAALTLAGGAVGRPIVAFSQRVLQPDVDILGVGAIALLRDALYTTVIAVSVPLLTAGVVAAFVGLAQTQFQIAPRAFEAKLDNLDPFKTFQKVYMSRQPFVELAKGILHVGALGAITVYAIIEQLDLLPRAATMPASSHPALLTELGGSLVIRALPVMAALAAIDYSWSYYTWWTSMMRTDKEIRDEHKENEGDPHFRAHRRRRMRELATRNVLKQLQEADVLVTNPTHIAIGLRYRPGKDVAPVVVVKAVDHMAQKLRMEAFRLGIPRVEDRPLARALHASVPQGKHVPAALFGPVAKVLAVVYRRRRRS